jgi:SAM-dependent methyltransferase
MGSPAPQESPSFFGEKAGPSRSSSIPMVQKTEIRAILRPAAVPLMNGGQSTVFDKAARRATSFLMRLHSRFFIALLLSISSAFVQAQATPAPAPSHPTSTPYTGDLSIFEYPERDARLQPQRILTLLGVRAGSSIADIGAGSGWLTVRAAQRVGPNGLVFAEDINPEAIEAIRARAQREHLPQIRAVLGLPDDPKLPPDSIDAVVILKTYHEIAHPNLLLHNLIPALRPGAKLGIIDRNGNGANHGLDEAIVVRELADARFRQVARYNFTKADGEDYFLIFEQSSE